MKWVTLFLGVLWMVALQESWAGDLIYGPETFIRGTGGTQNVSFPASKPGTLHVLAVDNGQSEQVPGEMPGVVQGRNLVANAQIRVNGKQVTGKADFDANPNGFLKDITLSANNVMEITLTGTAESRITVEIREANPNSAVSNAAGNLIAYNMGDQIALTWPPDDRAALYIVQRSTTPNGPWKEIFRETAEEHLSMTSVDITPDARLKRLCYRVLARNAKGTLVRTYNPVCVPKFAESQSLLSPKFRLQERASLPVGAVISLVSLLAAAPGPADELCLSDTEFIDSAKMNLDQIRQFLKDWESFMQFRFVDVDGDGSFSRCDSVYAGSLAGVTGGAVVCRDITCGDTSLPVCNLPDWCPIAQGTGQVFDLRDQDMKKECRPCPVEMFDATVTVTDKSGAFITRTVTVH